MLIGLGMAVVLERRKTGKILLCTILSGVMGVLSGWFAQALYTGLIPEDSDSMLSLLIRGFGWGIMGIGIGLIFGLAAGDKKESPRKCWEDLWERSQAVPALNL